MNPSLYRQRFRIAAIAGLGVLCAHAALAGVTTLGTTSYGYTGRSQSTTYRVPSGANCITIQAWGKTGYIQASYLATPGQSVTVLLSSSNGGDTQVQTPNGTVNIATTPVTCSVSGSPFNVTSDPSGGPASPGAGNSYPGYVTIQANSASYTLTISASPASAGTISGAGSYTVGTQVSVKESPWNGYTAGGWGGPDGLATASPNAASTTIAMTSDRTLVANFTPAVPVFTSSSAGQTLVVGTPVSFQVTATQSPVFSATKLPAGLTISSSGLITGMPSAAGLYSSLITASNDGVSVQEAGVGANQVVNISSSTLGNNLNVFAGALDIGVNGTSTSGFCIDPWHSSAEDQWLAYNFESLSSGPKVADGMGSGTALQIEQLWQQYYSTSISNSAAAGLQIAIWDLVSAAIGPQTGGANWFTLNSSNDYGASTMITWVDSHSAAAAANLYAVSGNGQDYVVQAGALPQPIAAAAAATQNVPFMVYPRPAVASSSATIPTNQPYTYAISATGNPTSYAATGLPPGLSVDAASGLITGAPTTRGTYLVALTAANPGASAT
ncbi:MAG TPA: putative Ig domain-containing protein, partial [Opitutaceae bacterium]|nr:putative Ig domain-containing protein [Opitutaceae bacterium]